MSPSDCDTIRGLLPWFVGEDLSAGEFERVRVHLLACLPCRREAASLHRATGALQSVRVAPVPGVDDAMFAGLHHEVMAAVAGTEPGGARRPRWWRPVGTAAAALLLVGVGFLVGGILGDARLGDSVWQRNALPTAGEQTVGASQAPGVPWLLRPLGVESWQWLEDADAERAFLADRFPELEEGRQPGRVLRGNGLSVRSRLRSLVETRLTSGH